MKGERPVCGPWSDVLRGDGRPDHLMTGSFMKVGFVVCALAGKGQILTTSSDVCYGLKRLDYIAQPES